jgi:V/A-type H+-transporting ATPase subunit E
MNATDQVAALEKAILDRAKNLAEEHHTQAQRAKDRIHADSADRLRLLEERETLVAQARADREYRRRVQASEIRMQAELDRLRWGLVESVYEHVQERLAALARDEERYLPVFRQLLAGAAGAIDADALEVLVSDADHRRFKDRWDEIAAEAVPGRKLVLSDEQCACRGGVLVRTPDRRVSVNNTFEGRLERLRDELDRVVLERLFPSLGQRGVAFNG